MTDILTFMVKLPQKLIPVLEKLYDFFTTPILEQDWSFIIGQPAYGSLISLFFRPFMNTFFPGYSLLDMILGPGLYLVLFLSLVKWVIGILT